MFDRNTGTFRASIRGGGTINFNRPAQGGNFRQGGFRKHSNMPHPQQNGTQAQSLSKPNFTSSRSIQRQQQQNRNFGQRQSFQRQPKKAKKSQLEGADPQIFIRKAQNIASAEN